MQSPHTSTTTSIDDEISLWEIWQVLAKHKWLIFTALILALLGGTAFLMTQEPLYEATVSLKIGKVESDQGKAPPHLLETAAELTTRLSAQDAIKAVQKKGSENIVSITSTASSPTKSAEQLRHVVDQLIESHTKILEKNNQPVLARLRQLGEQRQVYSEELNEIQKAVNHLKTHQPVQASVLLIQRSSLVQAIHQVDAESLRLSQQLSAPKTTPTELLGQIVTPTKASKPKTALVMAVVTVLGLIAGVMLAFLFESFTKAKSRQLITD